jgi:hypothetical protein
MVRFLDRSNHRLPRLKLGRQKDQARTRVDRQAFIRILRKDLQQRFSRTTLPALPPDGFWGAAFLRPPVGGTDCRPSVAGPHSN